jgi:hypothetical protein
MKFTNLFSPVHLASDPSVGSDGQIYFNTSDNVYRVFYNDQWNTLLDQYSFPTIEEFVIGSASVATVVTEIEPMFHHNILVLQSASVNQINLVATNNDTFPIGVYVDLVRGSEGQVQFNVEPGQTLRKADDVFLTSIWQVARLIKTGTNTWLLDAEFPDLY